MSMQTFLKGTVSLVFLVFLVFVTSCSLWPWSELWNGDGSGNGGENYSPNTPAIEATATYSIALGGVAPGRDELVLFDGNGNQLDLAGSNLRFESSTDVVGLLPREGYENFADGSGALIIPQREGFAVVSYYIDDILQDDKFLVIVPPQTLIQIMVAEASTQLTQEADVGEDSHVQLTSDSPTANGIGSVTRNRVVAVFESGEYSLFNVNQTDWFADPPASYWNAVIEAKAGNIYQYSPVDPGDPSHYIYMDAEARGFLDVSLHRAYDQAVLSAAGIFSDNIKDATGGAFAFFSPDADEWKCIKTAFSNNMTKLPAGCGVTDDDFPRLSPIQIVILEDVWIYKDGRPAFVFIRSREPSDYAVVRE